MNDKFVMVGAGKRPPQKRNTAQKKSRRPIVSGVILGLIVAGCLLAECVMTKDPTYMDLAHYSQAPCGEFLFGTDTLGRDIFSMVWYGGRISLGIGLLSTAISTGIAILYGTLSGIAPDWLDHIMMRLIELVLSIPSLLIVIFVQAILGEANVLTISLVIGMTGWMSIAKVVRTEVRQLRSAEYVLAAKSMGGSFWHILYQHFAPNFISSIMFMVVMNIRSAIASESTLSFLGIGLPVEIISWGSMLSLADQALLTNGWWMILIPGAFLVITLLCVTNLGNALRREMNRKERNL